MKGLIIISIISLLNLIFSKNNPTNVLVIQSSACGNCRYFNYKDVSYILKKQNYQEVVNIKLLPTAHLVEQKINGTYIYSHQFFEPNLRYAFAQFCANNLYSNEIALKWASSSSFSKNSLNDTIKSFFTEDAGASMINCIYGKQGHEFARGAWVEYLKFAMGGPLPIVIVDGVKKAYTWDKNGFFLDKICKNRNDKSELVACSGVSSNNMAELSDENYDNFVSEAAYEVEEIKEVKDEVFDYQKFWASADEEDTPIVGFESRKKVENTREHLKFFDADDE